MGPKCPTSPLFVLGPLRTLAHACLAALGRVDPASTSSLEVYGWIVLALLRYFRSRLFVHHILTYRYNKFWAKGSCPAED